MEAGKSLASPEHRSFRASIRLAAIPAVERLRVYKNGMDMGI